MIINRSDILTCLQFENSLNAQSGTNATIQTGTEQYRNSITGKAFDFDGSTILSVGNSGLSTSTSLSILMKVNIDSWSSGDRLFGKRPSGAAEAFWCQVVSAGTDELAFRVRNAADSATIESSLILPPATVYAIMFYIDFANNLIGIKSYETDGSFSEDSVAFADSNYLASAVDLTLGSIDSDAGNAIDGYIDDFTVIKSVITDQDFYRYYLGLELPDQGFISAFYTDEYSMLFNAAGEKAISIGGVSDFSFIQNSAVFTISLWFKMSNYTDGTTRYFMGNTNSGSSKGFYVRYQGSDDSIGIVLTNGTGTVINSSTVSNYVTDNRWHHLVISGDATNIFFYLDGVKSTGTGTIGTLSSGDSANTLNLANLLASGSSTFLGNLNEVCIYSVQLSDAEVLEQYNNRRPFDSNTHSQAANLELNLDMDSATWNGSEYEILDVSGNNRNGTTSGMEIEDKVLDTHVNN